MGYMKRGVTRELTNGEITMVNDLFKRSVRTDRIKVSTKKILGLIPGDGYGISGFDTLRFASERIPTDFSVSDKGNQHWFIHEMAHRWQAHNGYAILWNSGFGLRSLALEDESGKYSYTITEQSNFSRDYNYEQQASMLADYYILWKHNEDSIGKARTNYLQNPKITYEAVLKDFLEDPFNPKNLPD